MWSMFNIVKRCSVVVSALDYISWGLEFKSHQGPGTRLLFLEAVQKGRFWVESALTVGILGRRKGGEGEKIATALIMSGPEMWGC